MLLGTGTSAPLSTSVAAFNPAIVLPQTPHGSFATTPTLSQMQIFRTFNSPNAVDSTNLVLTQHPNGLAAQVPIPTTAERCLDSFYHHFHASHPFVLPKEFLLRIAKDSNLDHLLAAMRYLGALYVDAGPSRAMFFDEAIRIAYEPTTPKDGFLVQTLLLLIIGLDGSCQQERARQILADAERIAVQIGLNTPPFTDEASLSWRRAGGGRGGTSTSLTA
jgi:hypothetical protein